MLYKTVSDIPESRFQRLTGVKRSTFEAMLEIVNKAKPQGGKGRPSKLSNADKILVMLMYYREYRSILHISHAYDLSEVQTWRIIRQMESLLLKSKLFHLPGKKQLQDNNMNWEVVVIDVTESSIERPKKNNENITQAKRKGTH